MKLLVVGAGEIGRWVADTTAAADVVDDLAFADRDPAVAADAADGRDARAVTTDTAEPFDAVCLAVPMSAVPDAVVAHADNAERGMIDVSGTMEAPLTAMRERVDGERASFHPLFAPPRVPGNVAVVVDEGGPVVDAVIEAIEAGGNDVFETTADEHDAAMETVQAGAHAAILSWALAAEDVREEFHTPVSSVLADLVGTVTEGSAGVYGEIQETFDGADEVAAAAREIADADREAFAELYERAGCGTDRRDRHD